MVAKPQPVICPVTSVRQNSPALASGAISVHAPKAIAAINAAAGALAAIESLFIIFPLFFLVRF
jgi:hypothetical protein